MTEGCNLRCTYCQPAGTKVLLHDLTEKNIEDVQVGDALLGFDEYLNKEKRRDLQPTIVEKLFTRESGVLGIQLENGILLRLTSEHPILVNDSWVEAGKLPIGVSVTTLKGLDFSTSTVKSVLDLGIQTVYNLQTSTRTYVGDGVCLHNCYEKKINNEISDEVISKSVDFLYKSTSYAISFWIFGGEPTLKPDKVLKLIETITAHPKFHTKKVEALLFTNAVEHDAGFFKKLALVSKPLDLKIQVSFDGLNSKERYTNPKFSQQILSNIAKLSKNFYVIVRTTVGAEACKVFDPIQTHLLVYNHGAKEYAINLVQETQWTPEIIKLSYEIFSKYIKFLKAFYTITPFSDFSTFPVSKLFTTYDVKDKLCGVGSTFSAITVTGDIQPCHVVFSNAVKNKTETEHRIGNVVTGEFNKEKLLPKLDTISTLPCITCPSVICTMCPAVNLQRGNDYFKVAGLSTGYCKFNIKLMTLYNDLHDYLINKGLVTGNNTVYESQILVYKALNTQTALLYDAICKKLGKEPDFSLISIVHSYFDKYAFSLFTPQKYFEYFKIHTLNYYYLLFNSLVLLDPTTDILQAIHAIFTDLVAPTGVIVPELLNLKDQESMLSTEIENYKVHIEAYQKIIDQCLSQQIC